MKGTQRIQVGDRVLLVEQVNSHKWEAWYEDDHSVIFEGRTKTEVLEEAL